MQDLNALSQYLRFLILQNLWVIKIIMRENEYMHKNFIFASFFIHDVSSQAARLLIALN